MNNSLSTFSKLLTITAASLLITACATATPQQDTSNLRNRLIELQSDSQLASRAPVEIREAELAVSAYEAADSKQSDHLQLLADRKIDIARARAQTRLLEDQRKELSEQREQGRLDSRTAEADRANQALGQARTETDAARRQSAEYQRQISDLNARPTERGLVLTLGDVLFATGQADLRSGATDNLDKLAAFLKQYPERTVAIEGHTDSTGSAGFNLDLSQRRADSVKTYLTSQGINASRLSTSGKGEAAPVASNQTTQGRQSNRRVEVIISDSIEQSATR